MGQSYLFTEWTPRSQLVNNVYQWKNPVLFGTDSFWEGVDIKGHQLSNVILIKLPFKVPSDPVTEAIIEHITAQGKTLLLNIKFQRQLLNLSREQEDLLEVRQIQEQ